VTDYFDSFESLSNSITAKPVGADAGMSGPILSVIGNVDSGCEVSALLPMVVDAELSGKKGVFTVYLIYNSNGYALCSDNDFLHGVMNQGDARDCVKKAMDKAGVKGKNIKSFMDKYSIHDNHAFIDGNSPDAVSVQEGVFKTALESFSDAQIDDLATLYRDSCPLVGAVGDGVNADFLPVVKRYTFKKSLIIEGAPGSGKTHLAMSFAKDFNNHLLQGHENIEPMDIIGYNVPALNDSGEEIKVWKDGALTAAFRDASNGIKTVLLVDEILRIPARERSAFTAALAPDPDGYYVLATDRVIDVKDGVAKGEVLKAHKSNLCVIGTTNVGAEYDIDDIEPAFGERFRFLRRDTTPEMVKNILICIGDKFGYDDKVKSALFDFYSGLCKVVSGGKLNTMPNIRHFVDIMELAEKPENIKREAMQSLSVWCGRQSDGRLIEDEVDIVKMLIDDLL
jgi:hypothetical protein